MRATNEYVFFWGEAPFSNFTPCEIKVGNVTFKSSEQAFMYKKAEFFGDGEMARKIYEAETPKEAKALGRKVRNFDTEKWTEVSEATMEYVLRLKFEQHPEMVTELVRYPVQTFVEASPYDRIWGIGYRAGVIPERFPEKWGQNKLGKILTKLRDEYAGNQA